MLPIRNVELPKEHALPTFPGNTAVVAVPDDVPEDQHSETPVAVSVPVAELLIGRALQFPMHDASGVLLLAEGAVITPEFKRLLEAREVSTVTVGPEDAAAFLTARHTAAQQKFTPPLDDKSSRQMQEAVQRWLSAGANRGTALRQRVARHGTANYDAAFTTELRQQHLRTTASLTIMMHQAQTGKVSQIAATAFTAIQTAMQFLTADIDGLMAQRLTGCPDSALARHCLRMSQLAMAMATEMELNAENVQRIGITALLHDWGMLRVPESIRHASEPPRRWDRLEVERHVSYTADLLDRIDGLPSMVPLVSYQVHEKLNGTGYPRRKSEVNIHLFARILHVADDYVTLTTPMGWRPAVMPYAAVAGMLQQVHGRAADTTVLRALLRVLSLFPVGSTVQLSDGSQAVVLRGNGDLYTKPVVRLTLSADGLAIPPESPDAIVNLAESPLTIVTALETPDEEELHYVPDPYTVYRHDTAPSSVSGPKWLTSSTRSRRGAESRGK